MALKAVFFDVGETLVDEERWWRLLAERSGLQPHVVWAALGVTIERGVEHRRVWELMGVAAPDAPSAAYALRSDDLYPDALPCL
jgi:FMN phosphatase YigB (HAD superfamily)